MNNKFEKLKQKMSLYPYKVIRQTIIKDTPIYVFDLSANIDCDKIANLCRQTKNSDSMLRHQSLQHIVRSWSTDYIIKDIDQIFLDLFTEVEKRVEDIDKNYTYFVDHFWYVIYNHEDSAIPHKHGDSDLASVFYPSVPPNSAPICFMPDITAKKHECIDVKPGNLVVFPGELLHYVPKSLHEGERISVSMNLFKKARKTKSNI